MVWPQRKHSNYKCSDKEILGKIITVDEQRVTSCYISALSKSING